MSAGNKAVLLDGEKAGEGEREREGEGQRRLKGSKGRWCQPTNDPDERSSYYSSHDHNVDSRIAFITPLICNWHLSVSSFPLYAINT